MIREGKELSSLFELCVRCVYLSSESSDKIFRGGGPETFFIDDEPFQGPEAYLLLTGIKSADVITEMGRVGVAPGCLVRVSGGEKGLEQGEMEEEEKEKRIKSGFKIMNILTIRRGNYRREFSI